MAGRLIDDDPATAYQHAQAARKLLPRLAVVREAVGLCAYANGEWALALAELRASRRINGSVEHLPVMADCERGLGRPERALALAKSADAAALDRVGAVELRIVISGARRDLGQFDAAVVALQGRDLDRARRDPWSARLFYAYADALLAAGRLSEAREWFVAAAVVDDDASTDAIDRVGDLDAASGRPEHAAVPERAVGAAPDSGGAPPAQTPDAADISLRQPQVANADPASRPVQAELVLLFEEP